MLGDTRSRGILQRTFGDESFPQAEELRFWMDLAIVEWVDLEGKKVQVRPFHTQLSPQPAEWISPMLDPITGHGMVITPRPGMFGILFCINEKLLFLPGHVPIDANDTEGYSANREDIPLGSGAFRTSRETKQIWTPNLILLQGANLCRTAYLRQKKEIRTTFYNYFAQSPSGHVKWTANIKPRSQREARFEFLLRNKVRPGRDAKGNPRKDDARQVVIDGGYSKDKKRLFGLRVEKVVVEEGKPLTESAAFSPAAANEKFHLQVFRAMLVNHFEQKGITSVDDFPKADAELYVSVLPWLVSGVANAEGGGLETDLITPEQIIEAIVGPGGFTDPTTSSVFLRPEFEGQKADKDKSPIVTDAEPEGILILSNPLESEELAQQKAKKAADSGKDVSEIEDDEVPRPLHEILGKARAVKEEEGKIDISKFMDLAIEETGQLHITQKEGTKWEADKFLDFNSEKSIQLEALEGVALISASGHLVLSRGAGGIAIAPDGRIKIFGTGLDFVPFSPTDSVLDSQGNLNPGILSNKGSAFTLTPDGVTISSGGPIDLRARGAINQKPGLSEAEMGSDIVERTEGQLRQELIDLSKVTLPPEE